MDLASQFDLKYFNFFYQKIFRSLGNTSCTDLKNLIEDKASFCQSLLPPHTVMRAWSTKTEKNHQCLFGLQWLFVWVAEVTQLHLKRKESCIKKEKCIKRNCFWLWLQTYWNKLPSKSAITFNIIYKRWIGTYSETPFIYLRYIYMHISG